ncbi:DUF3566 domain-containing protein [Streptomyces sp. RB6PN25]|uniref:DUF3566 domain-containing protein n=1 Tax=Streptomyces humicola TaxID=2953240 RepID=A0ABT1PVX2_9ACTN|nr:DUF3566 domain-containing protein [Streptomyces humicola]MCQ4081821.1 DUF3566 domain-containing protein [Streptomyces humicola]
MSGATGAAAGGAGANRPVTGAERDHGSAAARGGGQPGPARSPLPEARDEARDEQRGSAATATETREPRPAHPSQPPQAPPQPHTPPQAYLPPQESPGVSSAQAVRKPRPAAAAARMVPRTRSARLRVAKADPWSVMKVSFLVSIALGICTVVAVAALWLVLDAMGVFSTVGTTISDATGSGSQSGFNLQSYLSLSNCVLFTAVIAVIDVVLATALATLGAFIYNLSAGFTGGIELTLAEDE